MLPSIDKDECRGAGKKSSILSLADLHSWFDLVLGEGLHTQGCEDEMNPSNPKSAAGIIGMESSYWLSSRSTR